MIGKLIVFEGLSAAGKKTQTESLRVALGKAGHKVSTFAFPDYASPVGQLIAQYLAGKFGKKEDLVRFACMLYALDREQTAPKIRAALAQNDYVLLDRFTPANYAFQGALMKSDAEKQALWKWIDGVEQTLPQADLVIFLDVPRETTAANYASREAKNPLTQKGHEQDIHESDAAFEKRVHANYIELTKANPKTWAVVSCVEDGKLLAPEKIHARVQKELEKRDI